MHANSIDSFDLEAGPFKLVHEPTQWCTCVRTREDVLIHEKPPDEVLVLPRLPKTGDLEEEDTVVVQHIVDLTQERGEVSYANMFGHLETSDFTVAAGTGGDVAVVHA